MDFEDENFDADETVADQNDHYATYPPSAFAWLYIAVDIRDMNIAKIGLTTQKSPKQRIAEGKTYNPFIVLFAAYELSKCTYGVSGLELKSIEGYIHRRAVFAPPIKHLYTGRNSEWFFLHPEVAEAHVDWIIAKRDFSVYGKKLYTYYEGAHNYNDIHVPRMREIKTIYRPYPKDFEETATASGIPCAYYQGYIDFLIEYHSRDTKDKVYL